MIKLMAVIVTLTASSMTAVAAFDRGGTLLDKGLLVAMSIIIVMVVHLLPAISRRPLAWLVWMGCLLCAIYGHLTFLTHASLRAGDVYAKQSALTRGTERQIQIIQEGLELIKARSVSIVAAELAQTNDRRLRAALTVEIAEGKKAEKLREELVRLSAVSTEAQVVGSADPVIQKLAELFNTTQGVVSVAIGLTFAMLLELVGALLWIEALRPSVQLSDMASDATQPTTHLKVAGTTPMTQTMTTRATSSATPVTTATNSSVIGAATQNESNANTEPNSQEITSASGAEFAPETSQISNLRSAIDSGKCKATVSSIRTFLGCSQSRALELRRALEN